MNEWKLPGVSSAMVAFLTHRQILCIAVTLVIQRLTDFLQINGSSENLT